VAAVDVVVQLMEEIPLVGHTAGAVVPEVVMRVADGELRLEGGFLGQSQPIVKAKWHNSTSVHWDRGPMITQAYFMVGSFDGLRMNGEAGTVPFQLI
jgi:hypothetical protein